MKEKINRIDLVKWAQALGEASENLDVAFEMYNENDTVHNFEELNGAYLAFMERVEALDSEFRSVTPTQEEFRFYREAKERVEDYTRGFFTIRGSRKTITALCSMFVPNLD